VRADDAPPSTTAAARRLMRPTRYYDDGDGTNDGVDDGAGGPRCYRCGGRHLQRECSAPAPLKPCFACGELGHERAACPNGTRRGGRGDEARRRCRQRPTPHHPPLLLARCFRCGQAGHQARACTSSATTRPAPCLRCARVGCAGLGPGGRPCEPPAADLAAALCLSCGARGHLCCAPATAPLPPVTCWRCGGAGHEGGACAARGARRAW